jgi:hypothetical protein
VERVGKRSRQHSIPAGRLRAADRGAGAESEAEMGVRLPDGGVLQRPADDRLRPRLRRQRQRLFLLARCEDGLRLLVLPERVDHSQRAGGRTRQRSGSGSICRLLRRRTRQRLRSRCPDRPAVVENSRRSALRRAHYRRYDAA